MSLTTAEAAVRLDLGEPAVRQLVRRKRLRPLVPGARPLEFAESEVDAYQQRRWREQQRRARLGDAWAECERLLAGQAGHVSRSPHAQPSPERVEGARADGSTGS